MRRIPEQQQAGPVPAARQSHAPRQPPWAAHRLGRQGPQQRRQIRRGRRRPPLQPIRRPARARFRPHRPAQLHPRIGPAEQGAAAALPHQRHEAIPQPRLDRPARRPPQPKPQHLQGSLAARIGQPGEGPQPRPLAIAGHHQRRRQLPPIRQPHPRHPTVRLQKRHHRLAAEPPHPRLLLQPTVPVAQQGPLLNQRAGHRAAHRFAHREQRPAVHHKAPAPQRPPRHRWGPGIEPQRRQGLQAAGHQPLAAEGPLERSARLHQGEGNALAGELPGQGQAGRPAAHDQHRRRYLPRGRIRDGIR